MMKRYPATAVPHRDSQSCGAPTSTFLHGTFLAILAFCLSCGAPAAVAPPPAASASASASAASAVTWLCRPDRPSDPCRDADLSATELRADGSRAIVKHAPHPAPRVDCFYVYPTVDLELVPGNHQDLTDDRKPRATTLAQAARFSEACAVWAPLYRQVTIGTYLQSKEILERGLAIGFEDVERAFREYLKTADPQRRIVLIGHSQGAEMVVRLLRRFFDDDDAMRARLLLALPIGGDVDVAAGSTRGGSSKSVPVCSRPRETGCIVAYHAYLEGERVDVGVAPWRPPPGRETVCVDPSALDAGLAADERHRFTRAYFAVWPELRRFMRGVDDVTTPFVLVKDLYVGRCVRATGGYGYLEVAAAPREGDPRVSPVDLADRRIRVGNLGLHVLDMQLVQGDLIDMVARRAATLR